MEPARQETHRRNPRLEDLLQELNQLLACAEAQAIAGFEQPQHPVVLIVGCPRSGSTLFTQWLANLGVFAVPSNLLSRFYAAPVIGAMIQTMLTDPAYAFRDELIDFQPALQNYASSLGKTAGALSPHNFLYFWRRFFHFGEIQHLSPVELEQVDASQLLAELAGMEAVFQKPLAMKAMLLNWNLEYLAQIFPRFFFVHLQRDLLLNAQSLLGARREFYGSIESWYSYKPPEYAFLKHLDPTQQVAGQVVFTNQAIARQLQPMDAKNWMAIDYAAFCAEPADFYTELASHLSLLGYALPGAYAGPERFTESSGVTLQAGEVDRILEAIHRFASESPENFSGEKP